MYKDPEISVIVPVYNTESYLDKCITSILSQSFENFELILVDDGSVDGSLSVMRAYEKKDARIRILSQKNQGQGAARNNGIKISRGKYIIFADSDDYFANDHIFGIMYEAALENNASLVCAGAEIMELDGSMTEVFFPDNVAFDITTEPQKAVGYITDSRFMVSCCNKLYSAKIIKENHLVFQKYGEVLSEDTLFNYCYYPYCRTISVVGEKGYVQIKHRNSSSTTADCNYVPRMLKQIRYLQSQKKKDTYISRGLSQAYIVGGLDMLVNMYEYHGLKVNYASIKENVKSFYASGILFGESFMGSFFPINQRYYKLIYSLLKRNSTILLPTVVTAKHKIKRILKLYVKQQKK